MLEPGQMLSHYRLIEKIGEGGMGVVWKAQDTTLGREVAIKILPDSFAADPDRLARFRREAKLLASLNHPGIAVVHGLDEAALTESETAEGQHGAAARVCYLAMELVAGDSLQRRLRRGALPLYQALDIARQVAEGLEAAHEHDIIHRDLKPANILFGADGRVKIVDFGLAKTVAREAPSEDPDSAPTKSITAIRTVEGMVLGTVPYMSPEQARGEPLDCRVDVWAFGCVLYEMLTGKRAFEGKTRTDVFAAVLEREPDWAALPAAMPPLVRGLLRRCLAKDPARRLHDIADARIEIEEALSSPADEPPAASTRASFWRGVAWTLVAAALIGAVAVGVWLLKRPESAPPQSVRIELTPPDARLSSYLFNHPAISPDGRLVAYCGKPDDGSDEAQLYVRPVDELDARSLPANGCWEPFFSSDGRWIGFQDYDSRLLKVPAAGGVPLEICNVRTALRGASWGRDGSILFAVHGGGLYRVSAEGGEPELVVDPGTENAGILIWPQHLPGDDRALASVHSTFRESRRGIAVVSLDTGEVREILTGGTYARYVGSGHLVLSRLGTLYAVPFDADRLEVRGSAVPVLNDVSYHYGSGAAAFAIADSGALVYGLGAPPWPEGELIRIDRRGNIETIDETPVVQKEPISISPDGRRLAASRYSDRERFDIWIYEFERRSWTRLTFDGSATSPVWSPDGEWIVFNAEPGDSYDLFRIRSDGTGEPERLTSTPQHEYPTSLSPDGRTLAFWRTSGNEGSSDILTLRLDGERNPEPFVATPRYENSPAFSPDGRWLAYACVDSDEFEICVRPYPGPGPRVKVSSGAGMYPVWGPDGRELFYSMGQSIWRVPIDTRDGLRAGEAEHLFKAWADDDYFGKPFHVTPDGQRFVTVRYASEEVDPLRIIYAPNWTAELKRSMEE